MELIIKLLVNSVAIFVTARMLSGWGITIDSLSTALIVAVVLGLINTFIKPIIILFTLPINFLTLGLFTFVINAAFMLVVSNLVNGFDIVGFWPALVFSLALSIVNGLLLWLVK